MVNKRNTINRPKDISTVHTGNHGARQIGKSSPNRLSSVYHNDGHSTVYKGKTCTCTSIDDIIKPKR